MQLSALFSAHKRWGNMLHYRSDIDGLRAIAVIAVILFHLQVPGFGGGYVGVDIFFVISGFLITGRIRQAHDAGAFRLADFYERRVRRLAPSFLAMLFLSVMAATLMLSPADISNFAGSAMAALGLSANIFFYTQNGYFNADADNKPLLHTWSLGVEEQFYLFWPLLLLWLLRSPSTLRSQVIFLALGAASLLGAIVYGKHDASATFYLLPSRIYEFLIGAALVWLPTLPQSKKSLAEMLWLVGIAMIAISVAWYTRNAVFPSYRALLPCAGAACVIYAGQCARLRLLLGNPLMAYIGRISYELYLFHWPVIVFYKYLAFSALQPADWCIIVAITTALSMLTYHAVGLPLRYRHAKAQAVSWKLVMIGCATCIVALMLLTASMKLSHGWAWRIPERAQLYTQNPEQFHFANYGGAGYADDTILTLGDPAAPPQFFIFGDSFAAQYASGLSDFLKAHQRSALAYFHVGCIIMPQVISNARAEKQTECEAAFSKVSAALQNNTLPIIQAQSWNAYKANLLNRDHTPIHFPEATNDSYYQFIIDAIEGMRQTFGTHRYVFVGITPGIKEQKAVARCFQIPTYIPNHCAASVALPEATQLDGQQFNMAALQYARAHPEVTFINARDAFCYDGFCHAITDARIFYSDDSHLSKDGASQVLEHFQDVILSLHPGAISAPAPTPILSP